MLISTIIASLAVTASTAPQRWIQVFDGRSLANWTAKIKGYPLGENFANTFRVAGGAIQVNYDGYGGKFDGRFGHLFLKTPYAAYRLRLKYRFLGKQLPDGPGWAYKNSGIMIFCQDPSTIGLNQDFPVSAEVQLLGGDDQGERHTGNLCTPGTNVMMNDKLVTQHCTDSTSDTFRGETWVSAEVRVDPDGSVTHFIMGKPVMMYKDVQLDEKDADAQKLLKGDVKVLKQGWISLQSESHPIEFKDIALMPLE